MVIAFYLEAPTAGDNRVKLRGDSPESLYRYGFMVAPDDIGQ